MFYGLFCKQCYEQFIFVIIECRTNLYLAHWNKVLNFPAFLGKYINNKCEIIIIFSMLILNK